MNWLNLELTTLRSEEYLGSEPSQRATWLNLMAYCADQENGGVIKKCIDWPDRKWMQLLGVTKSEVLDICDLWNVNSDSISVVFYQKAKELEVKAKREAGKKGGRPPKTKATKPSGLTELKGSKSEAITEEERKGKEEELEGNKKETKKAIALRVSNFFNSNRGSMPECKMMTDKRIKAINARISDYGESAVCELITKATESDFLQGKTDAGFKCGIDWIMNPSNYVKIAEGNYENKANHSTSSPHLHVSSSRNPEDYQL